MDTELRVLHYEIPQEEEMTSTRRTYMREYKIEAVRLVTEEGYRTRQAAESLGVSQNALRTWRKLLEKEADAAFPGKGKVSSHDEQLRRLQEENRRLRMERDILKKATAFFANDPN